jgi:hypothetical protein
VGRGGRLGRRHLGVGALAAANEPEENEENEDQEQGD